MKRLFGALCLGLCLLVPLAAAAQWPERPVRIVVPYAPGAMGDVISRLLTDELRQALGQPVIVDNRTGAGGNIGTAAVANAEPDGYTILVGATNNFIINQFLYSGMGFDPLERLTPVTTLVDVPSVIFLSAPMPARFDEFVTYARAHKGKLNYGSPGAGTTPHLSAELISRTRDLGMTHIAFKGSSPGITALLANQVQFYMGGAGLGAQHVKAGRLHAVAVAAQRRLDVLPETPTFAEVGLSDIKASNWWGVAVPRGTPPQIVRRLHEAFSAALAAPAAKARFEALGVAVVGGTPEDAARRWRDEADYWGKAVKEMGVRID
ncbi:MAG TPA: tripartite tricarboxylate transporter substrate binding protein [Burkholderiales bacterium]|nr:tripartite tricarboxylate transporter substrate binding protein [Burkholderiales bacterium]